MKINWKVRFKNGVFLSALVALVVSFAFDLLAVFDISPAVTESTVLTFCNIVLKILAGMGIISDPTTAGVSDSERALTYTEPYAGENG